MRGCVDANGIHTYILEQRDSRRNCVASLQRHYVSASLSVASKEKNIEVVEWLRSLDTNTEIAGSNSGTFQSDRYYQYHPCETLKK